MKLSKFVSKVKPKGGLNRKHIIFLVIMFLTIIATMASYTVSSLPTIKTFKKTVYKLSHNVDYSYTVLIAPNFIYDNASLIGMDKIAYLRIAREVIVNGKYYISSSEPIKVRGTYSGEIFLENNGIWSKKIGDIPPGEFENQALFTISINTSEIQKYISIIEEETGVRSSKYVVKMVPRFAVNYTFPNGKESSETIVSSFTVTFDYGRKVLSFGNIHEEYSRDKVETYSVPLYANVFAWQIPVDRLKVFTYMITLALASSLMAVWVSIVRTKEKEKEYKTILEKYDDIIIRTNREPPSEMEEIGLKNFKDLLKISANLNKPILYTHSNPKKKHIFWTIGNKEIYTYVVVEEEK